MTKGIHVEPIGGHKLHRILDMYFEHGLTILIISKRVQVPTRRIAELIEEARSKGRTKRTDGNGHPAQA